MRRTRRFSLLAALAAALVAAGPASAAQGSAARQVYQAYQKTGTIAPCKFSAKTLEQAKKQVGPDIKQYAPDFLEAIQSALDARASGACDKKAAKHESAAAPAAAPSSDSGTGGAPAAQPQSTPAPAASTPAAAAPAASAPVSTPAPAPTADPAPAAADDAIPAAAKGPIAQASGSGDAPAPLLVLAILAGVVLLLVACWSGVRWLGYDPPWLARWRHAAEEAGWRTSAAWSEFTDWVRLGR